MLWHFRSASTITLNLNEFLYKVVVKDGSIFDKVAFCIERNTCYLVDIKSTVKAFFPCTTILREQLQLYNVFDPSSLVPNHSDDTHIQL